MTFVKTALFHKAGEGSGGGGGGDQHNLGWYATESALTTAHPTANDGDWAIVGATDTVWVWDSDTTAWKDTGAAGIELPDQTGHSGDFLTTNGSSASWSNKPLVNTTTNTNSLAILGSAYNASCINSIAIGKDAVVYSQDTVTIGYNSYANGQYGVAVGKGAQSFRSGAIALGNGAHAGDNQSIAIGYSSNVGDANSTGSIVIGSGSLSGSAGTVAIGVSAKTLADGCIQLGGGTNTDAGTFCVATKTTQYGTYTNYKLMDSDGTIPADRLPKAINKYSTMPTAASTNEGWIVQFTGTTDATYTHGYIYECVSDGGNPATYSWTAVQVQAGGSSLPSQTGNSGKFLTTDGTDASWSDKPLVNKGTGTSAVAIEGSASGSYAICIGANYLAGASGMYSFVAGHEAYSNAVGGIAIGYKAKARATSAIQLGSGTNSDSKTLKVAFDTDNYELLSADGTIPAARHAALPAADGTYTLQLVITDGVPTLSWVAA